MCPYMRISSSMLLWRQLSAIRMPSGQLGTGSSAIYMVMIREVSFSQKYFCAHLYAAGTAHQRAVLNFRVSSYVRRFNCACLVSDPSSPLSMHAICRHRVCMGQKAIPMPYTYSHTLQETHALGTHRMHYVLQMHTAPAFNPRACTATRVTYYI